MSSGWFKEDQAQESARLRIVLGSYGSMDIEVANRSNLFHNSCADALQPILTKNTKVMLGIVNHRDLMCATGNSATLSRIEQFPLVRDSFNLTCVALSHSAASQVKDERHQRILIQIVKRKDDMRCTFAAMRVANLLRRDLARIKDHRLHEPVYPSDSTLISGR